MAYIKNGVYPLYDADIRREFPRTSFPVPISDAQAAEFGYMAVTPTLKPAKDDHCVVVEGAPINNIQTWVQVPLSQSDTILEFTTALEAMYDAKAQERQYDTRYTCALRAGYAGAFQAEGLAFARWMDAQNRYAYTQMALVLAGNRPMPTVAQLLSELEPMVWP